MSTSAQDFSGETTVICNGHLGQHPDDRREFVWTGSAYVGQDGLKLWVGWSTGGWNHGPSRYSIVVSVERPETELIREVGSRAHTNETDVTRSFRPLLAKDLDRDWNIYHGACRAVTVHFEYLLTERAKKDRRRIEDRLRKDAAFLRAVVALERKLQEDEY